MSPSCRQKKVAKLRYQQFIYRTNADIVILPPFLLSDINRLSTRLSTPPVWYQLSLLSTKKVAKLRYQQIIYRTNADIVILPPFLLSDVGCLPLVGGCRRENGPNISAVCLCSALCVCSLIYKTHWWGILIYVTKNEYVYFLKLLIDTERDVSTFVCCTFDDVGVEIAVDVAL